MAGRGQRTAGAWPARLVATAVSRRVAERSSLAACSSTEQRAEGSTGQGRGKVSGRRAGEALMAGSEHGGASAQRARVLECPAARAQGGGKGERERE